MTQTAIVKVEFVSGSRSTEEMIYATLNKYGSFFTPSLFHFYNYYNNPDFPFISD